MPRLSLAATEKILTNLLTQRQTHVDALAEIDAVFARYGISIETKKRRGRKPGRKPGRKHRRHFDQNAEDFVLGLLKGKAMTTAAINVEWMKAKRGGRADNTLLKLVVAKKVNRTKVKGEKGSEYRVG